MTKILAEVGDSQLTTVLPKTEAGACVPEAGRCCPQRYYRYDRNGICQKLRCGCHWYPIGC